jgi:Domain of unknown function (DUF1731)
VSDTTPILPADEVGVIRFGRRAWLPVPTPLVLMGLGVVTDILVRGKRVIPAKASAAGYQFGFPVLETALRNLLPGRPGPPGRPMRSGTD